MAGIIHEESGTRNKLGIGGGGGQLTKETVLKRVKKIKRKACTKFKSAKKEAEAGRVGQKGWVLPARE